MRYNVGDRVEIKRGLVVGSIVGGDSYEYNMEMLSNDHNYILTIKGYNSDYTAYRMLEDEYEYNWTEEMVDGLAEKEPTDREKFERWMRKLSSLDGDDKAWYAFDRCTVLKPDEDGYENYLKTVSDYLFGAEKKKMTKAEIEAELGYEIEIVEE